jgi:hypothetical protein
MIKKDLKFEAENRRWVVTCQWPQCGHDRSGLQCVPWTTGSPSRPPTRSTSCSADTTKFRFKKPFFKGSNNSYCLHRS